MKNTLIISILCLLVAFNAQVLPYMPADLIVCQEFMTCPKIIGEVNSICAWYDPSKTVCKNVLCNEQFKFTCDICTNHPNPKSVIGYTLGECPISDPVVPVDPNVCTKAEKLATICTTDYNPVCGVFDQTKIQCKGIFCGATYSNRCEACKDENVYSVTIGECELHPIDPLPPVIVDPITYCPKKECSKEKNEVCAYYNLDLVSCKKNCRVTKLNACEACKDKKIIGWIKGPCPKIVIGPLPVDVALPDLISKTDAVTPVAPVDPVEPIEPVEPVGPI